MSSWLNIGSLWPPKKASNVTTASGIVDAPCGILLRPGDRIQIQKIEKRTNDKAPTWRLVVVPESEKDSERGSGEF